MGGGGVAGDTPQNVQQGINDTSYVISQHFFRKQTQQAQSH